MLTSLSRRHLGARLAAAGGASHQPGRTAVAGRHGSRRVDTAHRHGP